uniref:Polyprotein protein n=1 Tax=Solanum tuberosum TaxID=4113 RepID=M1DFJ8_SOLTU
MVIDSAILSALTPLRASIDDLSTIVTACEIRQGETFGVSALEAKVANLRKNVDYLKATNFTSLIRDADDEDATETSGIPLATIGDVQWDSTAHAELDAKTDEELISVHVEKVQEEESIFCNLPNLVETIVEQVTQISLAETSTAAPSGFDTAIPSEETPGTDSQVQTATPATETPIERETA